MFCLKLYDFTPFKLKFSWGRTTIPPTSISLTYSKMLKKPCRMCLGGRKHRGGHIYEKNIFLITVSMAELEFDQTNAEQILMHRAAPSLLFFFVKFVSCQISFRKVGPPPPPLTKIPDPRLLFGSLRSQINIINNLQSTLDDKIGPPVSRHLKCTRKI